ncbi:MAG TPA: NAD(P)/FAD-dependent oxidoreductase [Hypericibacter adhaerens]|jgi:monoamine oxidase|uniref:Tryptophan 2-monooxygenase n=1 Tax=Hypericibacter adhaerens TaxID=2602016 RepID=A0A5J6MVU9_9PROT|nr:NAD(P)/FAD-dependent oxidoreductase [Hypericibacter adhaerens]QEX21421.1 amine oxidase [Hypericibacter adhaerens]HWA44873.1 NAD(P)/FAD-dependent oxidoreductase [Hypericibacter adhaerens]
MAGAGQVYDVAIVGAGSAGLAAAKTARGLGLETVLLEASHRIGGRGYTEELAPGVAFDLGCHWMHSASLNPYVAIAEKYGFHYRKGSYPRGLYIDGRKASAQEGTELDGYLDRCHEAVIGAAKAGRDISLAEATERENRWTPVFDYWTTIATSADSDQVSVMDTLHYNDTEENWPLKEGFGALIARFGADVPVTLNCAVQRIEWGEPEIRLETKKGTIRAKRVIVAVSTGILGAGDIAFDPVLPNWKLRAIEALPLGTHNRIGLMLDRDPFGPDFPKGSLLMETDTEPMGFGFRPFGDNWVVGYTGGRFAVWLERAGQAAAIDLAKEKLAKVFGSDIKNYVTKAIVTAWAGDPWVKGSYSAAQPGQGHQRAELARALEDRLFFAGEATSTEFHATAHGAYITGIDTAKAVAKSLGRKAAAQ